MHCGLLQNQKLVIVSNLGSGCTPADIVPHMLVCHDRKYSVITVNVQGKVVLLASLQSLHVLFPNESELFTYSLESDRWFLILWPRGLSAHFVPCLVRLVRILEQVWNIDLHHHLHNQSGWYLIYSCYAERTIHYKLSKTQPREKKEKSLFQRHPYNHQPIHSTIKTISAFCKHKHTSG